MTKTCLMDLSGEELDMMAGMEADISYSATAHLRRAGPATRLSTEQLKAKDGRLRNYYDTAGTATASLRSAFEVPIPRLIRENHDLIYDHTISDAYKKSVDLGLGPPKETLPPHFVQPKLYQPDRIPINHFAKSTSYLAPKKKKSRSPTKKIGNQPFQPPPPPARRQLPGYVRDYAGAAHSKSYSLFTPDELRSRARVAASTTVSAFSGMAKSRYAAPHLRIIAEKKEEEIVVWECG